MEATELTWADRIYIEGRQEGREEGREEGRVQGSRNMIESVIRARFGRLSPELEARLADMTRDEELAAFAERVGKAQSEADLLAP